MFARLYTGYRCLHLLDSSTHYFTEEYAVFGVPLATAVERLGCLDGVAIPLPVRHCIDCIHACGLSSEGLYKTAGVKAKLHALKKSYNSREPVSSADMDAPLAASLLIMFLRFVKL